MHNQVKDNNRLIASNMIQSFDNSFQDVYNLINSIDTLPYRYVTDKNEEPYNNYLVYKSLNKLVSSSSSSEYIDDVVIYNESAEIAVTSKGTIDSDTIFTTYYINSQYNSLYWSSFFNENSTLKIFPTRNYTELLMGNRTREKNLIVIAGKIHKSLNNILVFVNVNMLLKSVEQNRIKDSSFVILDPDDHVILNTDEDINLVDVVNDFYVGEGEKRVINNQEYEYVMYKSDYNGFTYINRLPYEDAAITSIAANHRITTIISVILAIILTFLLSFYLFRPNIKLKKLIGGDYNWNNINNRILDLKQDRELYKHQTILIEEEIRQKAFADVVSQNRMSKNLQMKMRSYVNEFFLERQFLLVSFSAIRKTDHELAQKDLIKELKAMIPKELKVDNVTLFHMKERELLLLIGIHTASDRSKVIQALMLFVKIIDQKCKDALLEWDLTVVTSSVYDSGIENLQLAYQSMIDIPFYRNINQKTSIYDVEAIRNTTEVYFPSEKVDKLSNLLISGNDKEAIAIINEIIQKNIEFSIQYYQFATVLQSLVLSMKRHLSFSDEKEKTMHELELDFFNHIRGATNFEQLEKSFMKIIKFISKKASQDQDNKLNRAFIAQYIDLHYMEGLYLEHMASITNTSPKYFSKYFKKTFEVNFIEYLNRVRINRAKEFLKNKNNTVSEVGEKTGFMHATTFSSTFKRITGITPTQYRNKHIGRIDA